MQELQKSRRQIVDQGVREKVKQVAKKYFGKEVHVVKKEEVIRFMRFYGEEVPGHEPFPNTV